MTPLRINDFTLSTALGLGNAANRRAIFDSTSGLTPCSVFDSGNLNTWAGEIPAINDVVLPDSLSHYDCRNNRLAYLALQQDNFLDSVNKLKQEYGSHRIAVYIGTSTSGIRQTEEAYLALQQASQENPSLPDWYQYDYTQNMYSAASFIKALLGLSGFSMAISTACSSSAKAFASAHRAISSGICDAVIVGGVDTLCLTTLCGFNALQVTASEICRPSDINREGISIGEAAGFTILDKKSVETGHTALLGYGESADAHHMSTPHPEGIGAAMAMQSALKLAQLKADNIDYINLHGTATPANDLSESLAVCNVFGNSTPCSSTKGWTGHTLGAAGISEAIYSLMAIEDNYMPQSLNTRDIDPKIKANILLNAKSAKVSKVLSNSFGFGGSNCSLIFGEV